MLSCFKYLKDLKFRQTILSNERLKSDIFHSVVQFAIDSMIQLRCLSFNCNVLVRDIKTSSRAQPLTISVKYGGHYTIIFDTRFGMKK
ncbi:hypothetical protein FGO68_gene9062 [Halteria grandinella]|uniref:Uncharacterized protein n=1 Tax=Halteria grandinella TaxID=5974 RepID=A0A8J8NZZ3_HALGN|nr:hypothetical protein FGO68_gene9062 [Halteria grandinella]